MLARTLPLKPLTWLMLRSGDGSPGIEAHKLGQRAHDGHGECSEAGAGRNQQRKQAEDDVHEGGIDEGRSARKESDEPVKNRVDDHSALCDDQDAAGDAETSEGE